nr:MAG TPA: Baseplate wedge protein [Caudoviricetes sp.]
MAYDLALDAKTHDIVVTADSDVFFIDNAERVAQQIKIQLLTMLGEWFLDITHGVPYLEYILVKNPNFELIRQILKEQIQNVDDVEAVNSLELDYDSHQRRLSVTYAAETTYGLVTRREVLGYGNIS